MATTFEKIENGQCAEEGCFGQRLVGDFFCKRHDRWEEEAGTKAKDTCAAIGCTRSPMSYGVNDDLCSTHARTRRAANEVELKRAKEEEEQKEKAKEYKRLAKIEKEAKAAAKELKEAIDDFKKITDEIAPAAAVTAKRKRAEAGGKEPRTAGKATTTKKVKRSLTKECTFHSVAVQPGVKGGVLFCEGCQVHYKVNAGLGRWVVDRKVMAVVERKKRGILLRAYRADKTKGRGGNAKKKKGTSA